MAKAELEGTPGYPPPPLELATHSHGTFGEDVKGMHTLLVVYG